MTPNVLMTRMVALLKSLLFHRVVTSLVVGVSLWTGGCGYSTERPFRDDIQTVHVEMFQSKEFRRGLEFQFTEALVKRIEMDTPYRIAGRETADSVLSGEIQEVQQRVYGNDFETDRPRETGATITLNWRWKDLRSGEMLRERVGETFTSTYIEPVGESFETGMLRGLDGLAETIVERMEKDW
jgi:hypothetical protein